MSPSVTVKGEIKITMKKLIGGGEIAMSHFTGPGEILLAPHGLGDIASIRLSGNETWSVGKDAFLACTERVEKELKAQNLSKMMFSGEGWFTYRIGGTGILWFTSLGAIIRKDVSIIMISGKPNLLTASEDWCRREVHHRQRSSRSLEL